MESSVANLPKIDVRAAVGLAQQYFNDLQDMLGYHVEYLRLEEVELSLDKQFWLITLRFEHKILSNNPIMMEIALKYVKEYKIFKINAETGEVESMKIREH
ncbi:hypothetical protein [Planktothrix paucivesiculata]|uniref:Uncharacterized protein n=1 Tax=Planktothrix paucivesiculata PCC 9631 TaxID=671071 RepID=A0A7Z9DZG5_9CYAN|nr:hypothetical protein [Planktothrix paucivesiculata]VXD20046.1 conserved hypothetical protein [Planktothrix paucivesiculata PCC 9631]